MLRLIYKVFGGTTFEFEYLGEFKMDIKNILGHESAAHMGLIHEEKQRPKISCYCIFNRKFKDDTAERNNASP
jgi:hypothetical protein